MKLLLTSAGISNPTIETALISLLGKPISSSSALFIPTALHAIPGGTTILPSVITGSRGDPFCTLPWKTFGILELTSLPTLKETLWLPQLLEADALLVGGGDCQYLCHWIKESGLEAHLKELLEKTVWVGLSAGSMVMTSWATTYGHHNLPEGEKCLGIVDFAIHPHADHENFPDNSMEKLEELAKTLTLKSYAIDDQTAIVVIDGVLEVVSEGKWKLFDGGQ